MKYLKTPCPGSILSSIFSLSMLFLIVVAFTTDGYGQCPPEVSDLPTDITINNNDECSAIVTWTEPTYSFDCDGFTSSFDATDPAIWELNTNGQDGSVNTAGAPASIILTGSANGTAGSNTDTDFCITIPFDGNINFDWTATANGGGAQLINDEPAYTINGVETILNVTGSPVGSGVSTESGVLEDLAVTAGQVFCFRVKSNNQAATTSLEISEFSFEITQITQTDGVALGSEQGIGDYEIEYSVFDCNGTSSSCTFTVTVSESINPTITCPMDITMAADSNRCSAVVCYNIEVEDNCDPILPTDIPGYNFLGTFGGHNYFSVQVPGALVWEDANTAANSLGGHLVTITSQGEQDFLIDNLGLGRYWIGLRYSPSLSEFKWVNGEPFGYDAWGVGQPGGILEGDYVFNLDLFGTFADGWYDSESLLPARYIVEFESYETNLISGLSAGSIFPVGTTAITYEASDASGNTAECSFNVIVLDTQVPIIECPSDSIIQLMEEQCDTIVTFETPEFSDNCPDAVITQIEGLPSGSVFPIGTNIISFEVIDTSGNADTCTWNIVINDFIPDGLPCIGDLNLSLDETTCRGELTADMLIDVTSVGCADSCSISVTDKNGLKRPAIFTLGDVGERFEYEICCGGICCWGTVDVEYKFKPTINCPDTLRVSCAMAGMIDSIGLPTVDGNCTEVKVLKLDEYPIFIECDPLYTGGLIREFRAEDEFGNLSDSICSQVVLFERTNLSTIIPPKNRWVVDGNELSCDNNLELTSEGYPTPGSINSVPRLELDGGSLLDLYPFVNGSICNGYVTFTDKELGGSTECVTKIKRTWVVGEWHCSNPEPRTFVQILEIVDFTGPEFDPVADITVSTGSFDCEAAISMPLPTITDACNGENIRLDLGSPVGSYANYGGESIMLPSGIHEIIYNAYDDCGNITIDTVLVTVVDQAQPIAVCDLHTVVSIGLDGLTYVTAESIDDGSFDECGEVTLSIARMDDPGFADLTGFADKAPINCSDIGTEVMVGLLVTDKGGNTNMCMVSVEVQDKVEAQMIVPGPVTVDCNYGYDENNLSAFFGSVEIFDNCDTINTRTEEVMLGELNDCGAGELVREIRLIENGVEVGYGTQVITFEPGTTLQGSDILWPVASLDLEGCPDDMSNMAMTGEPTVTERDCQRIGMRHEDETFPFNTNGTCRKLIRTWYVIDWCIDHDEIGGALQPYTFTQTIKLNNTVAPTFVEVPVDTMYCSYAVDCGPIAVGGLTAAAEDDCTESDDLYSTYEVKDEGGSIVEYGLGLDANGVYDIGIYTVKYTIEDKCGNVNSRSTIFEVRNCKQPTPYCLDGLSTALVPMDLDEDGTPEIELVMLTPDFFDGGSFHPCGYEVTLSFSSDVNDTLAVYGCNDLGDNTVELWVTDVNGNQAYCEASLLIEDNNGVEIECIPDGNRAIVQGRIYTDDDQEIGTVQVDLEGSDLPWYVTTETGEYVFDDMPMGGTYTVKPAKDDDVRNGVNTLDLVFIQRHLLDLQPITNTYKLIAADINNDGSIKPSDLLDLRKVILGVNERFNNNTSWRFVDEGYVFEDPQHPLDEDFDETYNIASLSEDMWIDFIGLKVGDINGDATPSLKGGEEVVTRSGGLFELEIEDRNLVQGEQIVDVYSSTEGKVNGLQYALALIDAEVIDIHPGALDLTLASGATVGDEYRVSHASEERVEVERGDILFSIVLRVGEGGRVSEKLSITNSYMNSEVYVGEELAVKDMAINFIGESEEEGLAFAVNQNSPNPWTTNTKIEMLLPRSGKVNLTVTDGQGKLVYEVSEYLESGIQSIGLTSEEITTSGMYIYKVEYETEVITGKMIRIE